MNEVGKFMEALQNDPRAKELMESISVPVDEENAIDVYVDLANKLGFTISREDLLSWKQEKEKEYKAKSTYTSTAFSSSTGTLMLSISSFALGSFCRASINFPTSFIL